MFNLLKPTNVLLLLTITIAMFMNTGCADKERIVYVNKIERVTPPDYLLKYKVPVPHPPDKEVYVNSNALEKEKLLTKYTIELLGTLRKYASKDKKINEWYVSVDNNKTEIKK